MGIHCVRAYIDDCSVNQYHPNAQNIIGCDAIAQAVGAAGIHGDVACNGAGELGRGVGRVEKAFMGHFCRDCEICDTGLDAHGAVAEIDIKNLVHFADAEDNCVFLRDCAARKRCSRASGDDFYAVFVAKGEDCRDFLGGCREDDGEWHAAI